MDRAIWERLLLLESRDVVSQWFSGMHDNHLSARRSREIISASRQAREFFWVASTASITVRPLLAFYGVASLSRALTLLFRKNGGEESLTRGHGLETVSWSELLSNDLSKALRAIGNLQIRTCKGLFSDLIGETKNRITLHVHSENVDWSIDYDPPELGQCISLRDILDRLPDIHFNHKYINHETRYVHLNYISYNREEGASLKFSAEKSKSFLSEFSQAGYQVSKTLDAATLQIDSKGFSANPPQFLNTYVHKMFGTIPAMCLVSEFSSKARYSQIAVTYALSYCLGMLARYYPTQWTALATGEKGDQLWPSINAAQNYVEFAFPELVLETIEYSIAEKSKGS